MPSAYDQKKSDSAKKGNTVKTAFDSESFDADWTIHVPGLVGSATISPSGRDVALASPEGLAIIDLDSPYSPPRRLSSRGLPWLVVDVQWSPFAARDYWVASTANHRCLVWNLNFRDDSASGPIEHSLQGHSRAITDINFSAHHPDLLVTCSVDGYVHNWDLRRPQQPAESFCDWTAGATQVKFSRQDPHMLASSHDRLLHIWDERRPVEPVKTIMAHSSKIYGIDWNRTRASALVTCSLDKSIKFWDYKNEGDAPERVIRTDFPVWRARHTPFGWGVLAMPQNEPGNLHLFDGRSREGDPQDSREDPVFVFKGHGDHKAKEFLWRSRGGVDDNGIDSRDFQLVSWGADKELRLERMEADVLEKVGYVKGQPAPKDLVLTRKGATYKTFRTVDDGVHRDRWNGTMTDPRAGHTSNPLRRNGIATGSQNAYHKPASAWRAPSMKAKTMGKESNRSLAQIGWMRGVTMSKRKTQTGTSSSNRDALSPTDQDSIFGSVYHDNEWGEPDTLQDEFVRLTSQLPNVKWNHIDMDNLIINASLKGPWGVSGDPIHIKVKVDIPKKYPKSKAPRFFIDKSSFMTEETRTKIQNELSLLVAQFAQHKKNSLGPAFAYLLGEVDLAGSTSFLRDLGDMDDMDDEDEDMETTGRNAAADEESSSDSESDIPPGGSAAMSQELPEPTTGSDAPAALSGGFRQTVIPVKRTCGARFSNDGKLACFFPTKEEKARALFLVSTDSVRERSKGEPRFAGFGRLLQNSQSPTGRRNPDDSASDDGSGGSDADDSSSSSSSDSELASMNRISFWYRQGRSKFRKSWSANESVRSSGGGTGTGTGTQAGTIRGSRRTATVKAKNIVSIHDMRDLIPSKQTYAKEYAIFGDGEEVCEHNAQVAERHGDKDLMYIWRYAGLLLRSDIPLRLADDQQFPRKNANSFLVIARDAVSRFGGTSPPHEADMFLGKVKWGQHPLVHDFISDVFAYFEQLADIQMLAMLSCVFGDSWAKDSLAYAESHLTQPQTPLPMKAPSFSLEYFPTNPELWHQQQLQSNWQHQHHHFRSQASSAITTPRTSQTPNLYSYSNSLGSEPGVWLGDPGSYSCGETPPATTVGIRAPRNHHHSAGEVDYTQSLSTSPNTRIAGFRRSNSAIAAAPGLAASLPRTLHNIVSSSPPDGPTRKRVSPAEILGNLAPAVTWGASTVFGAGAAARHADAAAGTAAVAAELRAAAAAASVAGTRTPSTDGIDAPYTHLESMVAVSVSVKLFNESSFDDDGWMTTPFLEPKLGALYASYRHAYAEMLQVWGQPLARLEIMKFNILKGGDRNPDSKSMFGQHNDDDEDGGHKDPQNSPHVRDTGATVKDEYGEEVVTGTPSPTLTVSKRRHLKTLMGSGRGLDVTGICRIHETNLEPLQTSGRPLPSHYGSELVSIDGSTAEMTIGGAVGTCERCQHSLQSQLRCVYCAEPVAALYPACLGCGCPSHEKCLAEWHAAGERLCPAGDECDCGSEADNGKIESWAAIQAALLSARKAEKERQAAATAARGRKTVRVAGGPPAMLNLPREAGIAGFITPPMASPNAARPRRKSMPGGIGLHEQEQHTQKQHHAGDPVRRLREEEGEDGEEGMDREGWESVTLPPGGSGSGSGGTTTPAGSRLPSAAAHLNRLRKQVGEMTGRPSILRQRSGGVLQKKMP